MCRSGRKGEGERRCTVGHRDYEAERAKRAEFKTRREAGLTRDQVATEDSLGMINVHIASAKDQAKAAADDTAREQACEYLRVARERHAARSAELGRSWSTSKGAAGLTVTPPPVPAPRPVLINPDDEARYTAVTREHQRSLTDLHVALEESDGPAQRAATRAEQDRLITDRLREIAPEDQWDEQGYSRVTGLHRETRLDRGGYDAAGFRTVREQYNNASRSRSEHRDTGGAYDLDGYDRNGRDGSGIDRRGFDRTGLHTVTQRKFDPAGYDVEGYTRRGFDQLGYTRDGGRVNSWGQDVVGNKVAEPRVRERLLRDDLYERMDGSFDADSFMAALPEPADDLDEGLDVGPDGKKKRGRPAAKGLTAAQKAKLGL